MEIVRETVFNGVRVARSLVFWVKNKNVDIKFSAHDANNVL
jgi:hypothetical protein